MLTRLFYSPEVGAESAEASGTTAVAEKVKAFKKKAAKKPVKVAKKGAKVKDKAKPAKAAKGKKPAKKAVQKSRRFEFGGSSISGVQARILQALKDSVSVAVPKLSKKGQLTYAMIADEAAIAINGLTPVLKAESGMGQKNPLSLQALGLVDVEQYEKESGSNTPLLFSINAKGKEILAAYTKAKAAAAKG